MPTDQNKPEYFPELNENLRLFAQRMAKCYGFIERVTVHHAPFYAHQRATEKIKYIMLFQLPKDAGHDEINVFKTFFYHFNGPIEALDENFFPDRDKWRFDIISPGLPSDVSRDEPCWILFEAEDLRLQRLVGKAHPEIEKLYISIKKIGFSGRDPNANPEEWKEAAISYFYDHQKEFETVSREDLEDMNLYAFASGQEPRDFKGGLLKKIAERMGFGKQSARKLYKLHRQNLSKEVGRP